MKFFILLIALYVMVGTGVFISINSRTTRNCPGEDQARAFIYGTAWPMLIGFRILGSDMKAIPNCRSDDNSDPQPATVNPSAPLVGAPK